MDLLPVVEGSKLLRDGLAKLASHHCGKRCRATPTSTCTETTTIQSNPWDMSKMCLNQQLDDAKPLGHI